MAATTAAVIGAVATAGSAVSSAQASRSQARAQEQALANSRTSLSNFGVYDTQGAGARRTDGTVNLEYGYQFDPTFNYLAQNAQTASRLAGMRGLPEDVQRAQQELQRRTAGPLAGDQLDFLTQGLRSQYDAQQQQLNNFQSVAPGLANTAFLGAAQRAQEAGQGFDTTYQDVLSNLRQQAAPFEERQLNQLQNDLFGSGRLGTTGGALQTEAFARGLGQADLQRQLSARNEARAVQDQALAQAQGLAGLGSGVRGLDDQLLSSAFGRFNQTAQLAQNLGQQRFGNSILLNQQGYERALQGLNTSMQLQQFPGQLQQQQLNLALQNLQGASGIRTGALELFQAGLAAEQAAANARIGAASNQARIVGSENYTTRADANAQLFSGLANAIGGSSSGGYLQALQGLFSRSPTPSNTPGDPGFVGPTRGP
jgi:hypothetical protein